MGVKSYGSILLDEVLEFLADDWGVVGSTKRGWYSVLWGKSARTETEGTAGM